MSVYQESRRFTLFIFFKRPRVLFFFLNKYPRIYCAILKNILLRVLILTNFRSFSVKLSLYKFPSIVLNIKHRRYTRNNPDINHKR